MVPARDDAAAARARSVRFARRELVVALRDGRTLRVPLSWFPRLAAGTPAERRDWELLGDGRGIHWPLLDEDLSVAGLLRATSAPKSRPRRSHARRPPRWG